MTEEKNFIDLYQDWAKDQTDAPAIYHKAMAYFVLSCVVNNKISMPFGHRKLFPNLYFLLVGPSSAHRKSWSQNMAVSLIEKIYPDFELMECSSRESFIAEYASSARMPLGCGAIIIDELKGFIDRTKSKHHLDGFFQDLCSAYDGNRIRRRIGIAEKEKEIFTINDPFLCVTAACSNDWLTKSVELSDITGGFLARFIWVIVDDKIKNPKPSPTTPDEAKTIELEAKLRRITDFIGTAEFAPEANELWAKWYSEFLETHQGGKWDALYQRFTVIAKKIAILNAVADFEMNHDTLQVDEKIIIESQDLVLAQLFLESLLTKIEKIAIGANPQDLKTQKILQYIRKKGSCKHSELLTHVWGIDAWQLKNSITTLLEAELIDQTEEKAANGRVWKWYEPAKNGGVN